MSIFEYLSNHIGYLITFLSAITVIILAGAFKTPIANFLLKIKNRKNKDDKYTVKKNNF